MRRREFLAASIGALLEIRAVAAQQPPKMYVVGVLVTGTRDPGGFMTTLEDELKRLGYSKGSNLRIDFRSAEGKEDALPKLAAELVDIRVDVIVAWLTPAVRAAKQATTRIPIVMASAGDPVATGLVDSLARPGGNITGMAGTTAELAGKNIELVRAILPQAKRLGALCNASDIFTKPYLNQIEIAAPAQGFELSSAMIDGPDDLARSIRKMKADGMDAVIVQPSLPLGRSAELALEAHLPAASPIEGFVQVGGLFAYAGRTASQFIQTAAYVDKILKGTRPAELPIQQPTQFSLAINLTTAKALGLVIPPAVLARADEVIE